MNRAPHRIGLAVLLGGLLHGCTLQPPAATPLPTGPVAWSGNAEPVHADAAVQPDAHWWRALPAPGLDALVAAAEADAPTLAQAVARVEQARALALAAGAPAAPQVRGGIAATRTNQSSFTLDPMTSIGWSASFAWEIDLFGRLRHGAAAAQRRLDARAADADATRLALQAQVVDTVLQRHACAWSLAVLEDDLVSRETTLELTRRLVTAGLSAPLDLSRAQTGAGQARGAVAGGRGACAQQTLALAALTGLEPAEIERRLEAPRPLRETALAGAPPTALALPARVLAQHPGLLAALRNADAAWEDIGSARAAQLPSVSLSALLGRNWIRFGGNDGYANNWSLGPALSLPLLDGGAAAANVQLARARLAEALAGVQVTLRSVVQDVEVALSQLDTAQQQARHAADTLAAAQRLFDTSEANQRAGRLSLFELENTRASLTAARGALVTARLDGARAWVALVRATGNGLAAQPAVLAAAPP